MLSEPAVAEQEKNPFNLFDGILPHHVDLTWYVARSATRREVCAERSLTNRKMAFYIPRLTRFGSSGRRKIKVRQSLFEGYGFVGLAHGQSFYDLPKLEGVHGVISFGDGAQPKPANFGLISLIVSAEQAGHFDRTIEVERFDTFEKDEAVRVVDGKFRGFTARFARMCSHHRVKVLLMIFGRESLVEVDLTDIRKAA